VTNLTKELRIYVFKETRSFKSIHEHGKSAELKMDILLREQRMLLEEAFRLQRS
jgi:hypothetical protein